MRNQVLVVLASALPLVLGCHDVMKPVCPTVPVTVSVTPSSTTPTFTWTPNCMADEVVVYEVTATPDVTMWVLTARTHGVGTTSPVVYGQVPFSMRQTTGPFPLSAFQTYRVSVLNSARVEIGSKIFNP